MTIEIDQVESEKADIEKVDINLAELIPQIKGDASCNASSCHGKGYTGIRFNRDGSRQIMLCRCGRIGETDWVKMRTEFEGLKQAVKDLENLTNRQHGELLKHGRDYSGLMTEAMTSVDLS